MVLFAGLCIGRAEEGVTRGFAVTLLRKAGYRELAVAALSSLLFAASHSVNILAGQSPIAVGLTVVSTFLFGIGRYLTLDDQSMSSTAILTRHQTGRENVRNRSTAD
jgi:membrane protease YdiL (CAAX protease family)